MYTLSCIYTWDCSTFFYLNIYSFHTIQQTQEAGSNIEGRTGAWIKYLYIDAEEIFRFLYLPAHQVFQLLSWGDAM